MATSKINENNYTNKFVWITLTPKTFNVNLVELGYLVFEIGTLK